MDQKNLGSYMNQMKMMMKNPMQREKVKQQFGIEFSDQQMEMMEKNLTPDMMKRSLQFMNTQGFVFCFL